MAILKVINVIKLADTIILQIAVLFFLSSVAAFLDSREVLAKDFGKLGASFTIKEEPFLDMVSRKLKNIDIEAEQKKMQQIAEQRIRLPAAVKNIKPAEELREFTYNPTYVLEKDIILPDGTLLYKAGDKVNPFDHMDFNRKLYFVDAREKDQIKWLKNELAQEEIKEKLTREEIKSDILTEEKVDQAETRIILVAGSPLELQEELSRQIFFDQLGALTTKFGIKSTPAIAIQDKDLKMLKITEIYVRPYVR